MNKTLLTEKQPVMLVGFMGTGKSTIGPVIASLIGLDFIDIDREIEKECNLTVAEIFRTKGEKHFREVESSMLTRVYEQPETIVACGGGIVIDDKNRKILKNNSFVIWLRCPVEVCIRRCNNGNRPLLNQADTVESAGKLYLEREPFYRQVADMEVYTNGKSAEEIAESIALKLKTLMT